MRPASYTHNFARGRKKISFCESRGLIKNLECTYVLLLEVYFHFWKKRMRKRCFSTVFGKSQYWKASYLYGTPILPIVKKSIPSCPVSEETVADTKVLVFILMRSFIVTPFDLAVVNRKQLSFFVSFFFFFFERRKRCTLKRKKIIKLDPKQQTVFGLLGQQIRPAWTTKSETADDGDRDNENPQSQTEPTKHQTKMSLLCITV